MNKTLNSSAKHQAIIAALLLLLTLRLPLPTPCNTYAALHTNLLQTLQTTSLDIRKAHALSTLLHHHPTCTPHLPIHARHTLSQQPLLSPILYILALTSTPTKTAIEFSTTIPPTLDPVPLAPLLHHSWRLASLHANWSSYNAARKFYADFPRPAPSLLHVAEISDGFQQTARNLAIAGPLDLLVDLSADFPSLSFLAGRNLRPRVFVSAFAHFWGPDVDAVRDDRVGGASLTAVARVANVARYRLAFCLNGFAIFVDQDVALGMVKTIGLRECFASAWLDASARRDMEARWDIAQAEKWTMV